MEYSMHKNNYEKVYFSSSFNFTFEFILLQCKTDVKGMSVQLNIVWNITIGITSGIINDRSKVFSKHFDANGKRKSFSSVKEAMNLS